MAQFENQCFQKDKKPKDDLGTMAKALTAMPVTQKGILSVLFTDKERGEK